MKKQLQISVGQFTSTGKKAINQDFYGILLPNEPLLSSKGIAVAIADGISSSDVSQVASQTAIKSFFQDYYSTPASWSVKHSAQKVLKATNSWLYSQTQHSAYRFNKDKGYICTFSGIVFKSHLAHLFHCGDSRIYRLTDAGLEQLTTDHQRIVSAETSYLTRALGIHNNVELDYRHITMHEGDIFLLATDGVYEYLKDKHIAATINQQRHDLDQAAKQLVTDAFASGSQDNLTLQIVSIDQLPERHINEVYLQISQLPPAPSLAPRMHFDGFDILREIYISSRSHVFLAVDRASQEQVVIKTPSTELRNNQVFLESFLMEDWIAQRLNSAHLLKAIAPQRKRNYLYIVTEYIEGKTLAQWMTDNPTPDINTVRNIVEQIAKGMQTLHRQEMVHQDIRPNNIMIDTQGIVKIIDFGATKVAGLADVTNRNEGIVGTAQYTAPEYYLGKSGTRQADIFSLGVITYQMISGRLPFGNAIAKHTNTRAQQRLSYKPLSTHNNAIPEWLDYAINKAVQINPAKRYTEVSEFTYELKHPSVEYLHHTKPPLIERNPILFWQGMSVVLLCLLIWQSLR